MDTAGIIHMGDAAPADILADAGVLPRQKLLEASKEVKKNASYLYSWNYWTDLADHSHCMRGKRQLSDDGVFHNFSGRFPVFCIHSMEKRKRRQRGQVVWEKHFCLLKI